MLSLCKIEQGKPIILSIEAAEYSIKVAGSCEKPWFCGKDVCKILGYTNSTKAIGDHVQEKHKCKLQELVSNESLLTFHPQNIGHHENITIYISEPGLYSLVMRSKVPFAQKFQDLVYEEILPSIRKDGQYKLTRELEDAKKTIEEAKKAIETAEQEKELAQKKAIHFKKMVERRKARERNEIVYIATTKTYAAANRFKVGSVKSVALLKSRLASYNSGRPIEDRMYFCFIVECSRGLHLENRIKEILGDYVDGDKTTEMYVIHYSDLKFFVNLIATNYNDEVELHDVKLEDIMTHLLTLEPEIPEALILNGAELRSTIGGTKKTVKIDFDTMTDSEQTEWLQKVLKEIKTFMDGDELVIERRVLFDRFERDYEAKFNKVKMWKRVKNVAPELHIHIKY